MAPQTRLIPTSFQLDARSREAGRRGVAKARAALAEAAAKAAADRRETGDRGRPVHDDHATAA